MSLDVWLTRVMPTSVYKRNITHNLREMADEAGIYKACWRPEEIGIKKAKQLIPILTEGLKKLKDNPDEFKKYNPKNGWGDYQGLIDFAEDYLKACKENPNAKINISR